MTRDIPPEFLLHVQLRLLVGGGDCLREWQSCFQGSQGLGTSTGGAVYLTSSRGVEARATLEPRATPAVRKAVQYPKKVAQRETVTALTSSIDPFNIWYDVQSFTNFTDRCLKRSYTSYGLQARGWLLGKLFQFAKGAATIKATDRYHNQQTVVVKMPGQSNKTIVVGAHYDSCPSDDRKDPLGNSTPSPGADYNASGSMTILEALRVLMHNERIASGGAPHTIEFHWYASTDRPLDGSGALFKDYATHENREVVAMLNQDQIGYTGYVSDDEELVFGLVADFTDRSLTKFVSLVIGEYTSTPFRLELCGDECSDHVSATDNGYSSAFVTESSEGRNSNANTPQDTIDNLNLTHMVEHVKLVVGFVTELAFADLG